MTTDGARYGHDRIDVEGSAGRFQAVANSHAAKGLTAPIGWWTRAYRSAFALALSR